MFTVFGAVSYRGRKQIQAAFFVKPKQQKYIFLRDQAVPVCKQSNGVAAASSWSRCVQVGTAAALQGARVVSRGAARGESRSWRAKRHAGSISDVQSLELTESVDVSARRPQFCLAASDAAAGAKWWRQDGDPSGVTWRRTATIP